MTTQEPEVAGWLSPTRVWRLTQCPASVAPSSTPPTVPATPAGDNAGTLAHRAMQTWIKSSGHYAADPVGAMRAAIDTVVAGSGSQPIGWTLTSARLRARTPELVDLMIGDQPERVIPEGRLTDPALRLRGTPDVVTIGERIAVIDLKSETLTQQEVSEWAAFQLTIYAHLVERAYGSLPSRVEVFSLNRGRLPVVVTRASVDQALAAIATARASDPTDARPSPDVCRFCTCRFSCEPHWDAAPSWPRADCAQGVVDRVERSATGVVAVLLNTPDGPGWITGIPGAATTVTAGHRIRAVRLVVTPEGGERGWRWTTVAAAATY